MQNALIHKAKQEFVRLECKKIIEAEKANSSSLIPEELRAQKAELEATQEWETKQESLRKSIDLFIHALDHEFSSEMRIKITSDLDQLKLCLNEELLSKDNFLGFSNDHKLDNLIEGMYGYAKDLLTKGLLKDGSALFQTLTFLSPQTFDFWLGYGMAEQESNNLTEAIIGYKNAKKISPDHPLPELYLAETYLQDNNILFAKESMNKALELMHSSKNPEFKNYSLEVEAIQSKIGGKK